MAAAAAVVVVAVFLCVLFSGLSSDPIRKGTKDGVLVSCVVVLLTPCT